MRRWPHVLTYTDICWIVTPFPLTPVKTIHKDGLYQGLFEFFTSCHFFPPHCLTKWKVELFKHHIYFCPFMVEQCLPWRGRVSCPCIWPFCIKRRKETFTKIWLIYIASVHPYVDIVCDTYFSAPPANLLIFISYVASRCEHISERAVEVVLMHMAACYWSKLE